MRDVVLDSSGKERARERLADGSDGLTRTRDRITFDRVGLGWGDEGRRMTAADLDGDGRDELLVNQGNRVHALDRELKERWFWPGRSARVERVIPAVRGSTGTVIMSAGLVLDGATGRPRWVGQEPLNSLAQFGTFR